MPCCINKSVSITGIKLSKPGRAGLKVYGLEYLNISITQTTDKMAIKQDKKSDSRVHIHSGLIRLAVITILLTVLLPQSALAQVYKDGDLIILSKWDRGIKLQSKKDTSGYAYFWFYEWHLFDAVKKGEHTNGSWEWKWNTSDHIARMDEKWLKMTIESTVNGADLTLEITNNTDYDWPGIAAIIPCFNPGGANRETKVQRNPLFLDEKHENTFFLGSDGLELIKGEYPREIHFAKEFLPEIMAWKKESPDGNFVFSGKWPVSNHDAFEGLMVRESSDHKWVMGIAWESFLSVQGHNPWNCMHLSIRVGPLAKGETISKRGKIYLLQGTKEDCLKLYQQDFYKKQK